MGDPAGLHDVLMARAREAGFPIAGGVDVGAARPLLQAHLDAYQRWVVHGRAAEMGYLQRPDSLERRADPSRLFPGAKSVFCVLVPHPRFPGGFDSLEKGPRFARYLHGKDYHEEISDRLEGMMSAVALDFEGLRWKVCVDTSAVLERAWAALCGLGWIGKNRMLIHPKEGSYLFLAEVLLDRELERGPRPIAELCGQCERCLKSCPSRALDPAGLDSRKCISYLTLEKRGGFPADEPLKRAVGSWIAGCDLCQEACPFNFKPVREACDTPNGGGGLSSDWESLLREGTTEYSLRVVGSALRRVKPGQFSRNLALALTNAAGLLAPARRAALEALVRARLEAESDPSARAEWSVCLERVSSRSEDRR